MAVQGEGGGEAKVFTERWSLKNDFHIEEK